MQNYILSKFGYVAMFRQSSK